MPTVAFKSKVRTTSDYSTLTLIIRHRIVVGQPSITVHDMKLSLPDGVDILLGSQLLITVSGKLNGGRIPPEQVMDSRIANHLVEYLRLNAEELGINAVSNACVFGDTGLLTFSCTGSRPLPASSESLPVHSLLVGFDIDYIWQTNAVAHSSQASQTQMTAAMNPFSRQLSLPFLTVLNNAVERLVTFQLVRRYPLIFGSWCKQLDTERPFFTSIFSSIAHVMERSPHQDFKDACKKLLKVYRKRIASSTTVAVAALSDYMGSLEGADAWTNSHHKNDEETFFLTMDGFYRSGLKRPLFKGLSEFCIPGDTEDDALLDDLPALGDNSGLDNDSQFDTGTPSHADMFQVLIARNGNGPSDDLGYLEHIPDHGSLLQSRLASPSHRKIIDNAFHDGVLPRHFSPEAQCLLSPGREYLSDFFDDEENDDVVDFSRDLSSETSLGVDDWTNGVYDYASAESNIDYPAIHNTLPFVSHRDWSPDIEPSQEKSIRSSMGTAFAPSDAGAQPHKLPSLCYLTTPSISRTALDPSNYYCSPSSPPFSRLGYEPDHTNDGEFTCARGFDDDMLHEETQGEDLLDSGQPFKLQFDCDSGSDDHELIVFDQGPNTVALALGNSSAKTWSTISPEDDSLCDVRQITDVGQTEINRMDNTQVKDDNEKGYLEGPGPDNFGFLLVDFD